MGVDRQLSHKGADAWCKHGVIEEVKNGYEKVIGRQCRRCGVVWGLTACAGCKKEKFCELVSADGAERFCTADCRSQEAARRAKSTAPPIRSRGRR